MKANVRNIQPISPKQLRAHPANVHGALTETDPEVVSLRGLMDKHGQAQAAVVRPKPDEGASVYEIVIGHRRAFVCELLGIDVQCEVRELDDETALAILMMDNPSHAPADPFLEAKAVETLLAIPGWTIQDAADQIGKSVRWVAQRRALNGLSDKVRSERENPKSRVYSWSIAMLETVARLAPDAQDQLFKKDKWGSSRLQHVASVERLEEIIGDELHALGIAPWDLEDATLLPKAGACAACPKTSLRSPGLFDDDLEAADAKKATCRDGPCWAAKAEALALLKVKEFKKEHPDGILVPGQGDYGRDAPKKLEGQLAETYNMAEVKASTPKAVPALVVTGEGIGTVKHYLPNRVAAAQRVGAKKKTGKGGKEETPAERLKRSREEIGKRRAVHVIAAIADAVEQKASPPGHVTVLGLVAAFQVEVNESTWDGGHDELKVRKKLFALGQDPIGFDIEVWPRIQDHVANAVRPGFDTKGPRVDEQLRLARWVAEVLEISVLPLEEKAVAEIPDPKFWGTAKPAPKTRTKGDTNIPPKGDAPGVLAPAAKGKCRACGCTDKKACAGGCSWSELPNKKGLGLCSNCSGEQPKGKPRKAARTHAAMSAKDD